MGLRRYRVEVTPAAARQLRELPPEVAPRIRGAIEALALDPRPPAARALRGRDGLRLRIGDYRLLYTIDDGVLSIVVVRLGHRRDVYDR